MRSWLSLIGLLLLVCASCQRPAPAAKPKVADSQSSQQTSDDTTNVAIAEPNNDDSDNTAKVATDVANPVANVAKPGADELQVISFDELNLGMPEDSKFRPMMLKLNDGRAEQLNGCRISIGGHMNPPDQLKGLTEFVLLKNKECKFGPGGQADHLMRVFMKDGKTTDYTDKVIYVEGIMTIKPFPDDGPSTWSIYDIEATSVSTRAPSRQR